MTKQFNILEMHEVVYNHLFGRRPEHRPAIDPAFTAEQLEAMRQRWIARVRWYNDPSCPTDRQITEEVLWRNGYDIPPDGDPYWAALGL